MCYNRTMDVYFEQSLTNDNIDKHSKRTKTLTVIRYVCIAVIVLIVLLAITLLIDISSVASFFVSLLLVLLMMAPFVLTYILLGRMIANGNLEFDYLLNGSMFRIVKVINRKKRKKLVELNVSSFESLGHISSEAYDRYAGSRDVKKIFALTDYENEDTVYYIYYTLNGTKYLLHIAPNNEMIMALRKSVGRITVLDKSFKIMTTESDQ